MDKRIIGIDVARSLAVFGMILVNFKVVFGSSTEYRFLTQISSVFEGKASATFVVLAGIGIALITNSTLKNKDLQRLKQIRFGILKKAAFLFIIGLTYLSIWPADILHFYGIYMLVVLLFIQSKPKFIIAAALVLIFSYPILMCLFPYDTGWNFELLTYQHFWSVNGFIRNLFYNGFHPVIPWAAFMLVGLWFGKQDLTNEKFLKRAVWVSLASFGFLLVLSSFLIRVISGGNPELVTELDQILSTHPMPPLPIYMLSGSCISISIISICILLSKKYKQSKIVIALKKTGQLALTFYVAHVVIGMGIIEFVYPSSFGQYSLSFSIAYSLIFCLSCIGFAIIWMKYKSVGPVEWIMRKITK